MSFLNPKILEAAGTQPSGLLDRVSSGDFSLPSEIAEEISVRQRIFSEEVAIRKEQYLQVVGALIDMGLGEEFPRFMDKVELSGLGGVPITSYFVGNEAATAFDDVKQAIEGDLDHSPEVTEAVAENEEITVQEHEADKQKTAYLQIVGTLIDKGWAEAIPRFMYTLGLPELGSMTITKYLAEHQDPRAYDRVQQAVERIPPALRPIL